MLWLSLIVSTSTNLRNTLAKNNCTKGKKHIFYKHILPAIIFRFPLFADAASLPSVQFPKSLLNLTDSSNATSVRAYLTMPKLPSGEDSFLNTLGIMSSKSGRCVCCGILVTIHFRS